MFACPVGKDVLRRCCSSKSAVSERFVVLLGVLGVGEPPGYLCVYRE